VFDANVLVAAVVFPGGSGEAALLRIIEEKDQLVLSKPILDELLGVLARKFARDAEELARVALLLDSISTHVRPRSRIRVLEDDPDNRILECAVTGKAEAIVTGDKRLLALKVYRGTRMMALREFVER
jgi:uncharacterized protein